MPFPFVYENHLSETTFHRLRGSHRELLVHHPSQGYVQGSTLPNTDAFNNRGAQSAHLGGVNVAMADGHVTFILNSINATTYTALFTKAGNDVVGAY